MRKTSFMKKLSGFVAAAALSVMLMPAVAMADEPVNSTTAPDDVVVVNWTYNGHTYSDTIDLGDLWTSLYGGENATAQTKLGSLFFKSNAYNVIGTDQYVTINDVLNAASDSYYDEEEYETISSTAIQAWNSSNDTMQFSAWNKQNGAWTGVASYVKYNGGHGAGVYTKGDFESYVNFYGNTVYNAINKVPATAVFPTGVFALNGASRAMTADDTNATAVVNGMSMSDADAPRLMWGYDESATGNEAGNRFPSNIDVITVTDL